MVSTFNKLSSPERIWQSLKVLSPIDLRFGETVSRVILMFLKTSYLIVSIELEVFSGIKP